MFEPATLAAASTLVLVHIFVGKLRFLDKNRRIWQSAAGGVGIAYAFLVLLPKLARAQSVLQLASDAGLYGFLMHHAYLVALAGLIIYYGMDVAMEQVFSLPDSRVFRRPARAFFCVYAGSLSGYYLLVGYLMSEQYNSSSVGHISLCLFATAMILHYIAIDYGLRHKFGELYDQYIRWAFVTASIGGWVLAAVTEVPVTALALLNSLFAGALIVFTLKEKTPDSDRVHFWCFLVGVTGYSLLLLLIEAIGVGSAR